MRGLMDRNHKDGSPLGASRRGNAAETDSFIWAAETFGGVIRRAREAKELTQRELARRCEVAISSVYVSQIEKDDRVPSLRVCRLLAHALDLDEKRLMLLAYETNIPKEIRPLLSKEESRPYGVTSRRLEQLVRSVGELSAEDQDRLAEFWRPTIAYFLKKAAL